MRVKTILTMIEVLYKINQDVPSAGAGAYRAAFRIPMNRFTGESQMSEEAFLYSHTLTYAWYWSQTKEGHAYWARMSEQYWDT